MQRSKATKELTVNRVRGKIHMMRHAALFSVIASVFVLLVSLSPAEEALTENFNISEPMCVDGSTSVDYFKEAGVIGWPFGFKFLKPKKDVQWLETPMQHLGKTPPERWAKYNEKYCYTELPSSLFLYEPVDSVDAAKEWVLFLHRHEFLVENKKTYQALVNRIKKKFQDTLKTKSFPSSYGIRAMKLLGSDYFVSILRFEHNRVSYIEYTFTKDSFSSKSALFVDGPYLFANRMSLPPNWKMPPEEAALEAKEMEFSALLKDVPLKEIR